MTVMKVLQQKLVAGMKLVTPIRGKEFLIESISNNEVMLIIGSKWRTPISANCLNGIPHFLKGKGWVEIGAIHDYASKPGTLEDYINNSKPKRRSTGNYVASVLEYAGIVKIDRKLPSKVRLIKSSL